MGLTKDSQHGYSKAPLRDKMDEGSTARAYAGDKWTPLLFLSAAVSTLGFALPVGYALGVLNTPVKILQEWCNNTLIETHHVVLTRTQFDLLWSFIVSIFLIGGVVGGLTGAWFADRMGRKGTLVLGNILNVVAGVMFFVAKFIPSVDVFFAARILIGFSSGLMTTVVPMYLNELTPHKLSGVTGMLFATGLCFGILVSQIMGLDFLLGTETLWPYLVSGFIISVMFAFILLPFLPESPKFLYRIRHQHEKALNELARLRNLPKDVVAWEIRGDDASPNRVREKWNLIKVLSTPRLRLPLALVVALQGGQQFAGINAVFYYSTQIFAAAGLSASTIQYANIGAGFINFSVTASGMWFVGKFGRRPLLIISCTMTIVFLILLTLSSKFLNYASWIPMASVVFVLAFVFSFVSGLGPIPFFIGAELVDIGPRPTVMALGSVANWGGNFLVGATYTSLYNLFGENVFLIFAASTTLLLIFIALCLPETSRLHEHRLTSDEEQGQEEEEQEESAQEQE